MRIKNELANPTRLLTMRTTLGIFKLDSVKEFLEIGKFTTIIRWVYNDFGNVLK